MKSSRNSFGMMFLSRFIILQSVVTRYLFVQKVVNCCYTYYTGNMWGDPSNYTASINTSRITLEKGADLIINYIETLQK